MQKLDMLFIVKKEVVNFFISVVIFLNKISCQ